MEVISILFNHQPAIQGELAYFIKEFDNLLVKDEDFSQTVASSTKNLVDNVLPSSVCLIDDYIAQLETKASKCAELSQRILELDQSAQEKQDDFYLEFEEDEFIKSIERQKEDIEQTFNDSIAKLQREYEEMEKQLYRENSPSL